MIKRGRSTWWTRERVINGLKRFFNDFGVAPTSVEAYMAKQQFTGKLRSDGKASVKGSDALYPSVGSIGKFFKTMRDAWAACDIEVELDTNNKPWSPEEEWFIVESVGIIPREEVALFLGRSAPAIKRRLYEMGINRLNRWGWTLNHAERVLGISASTIKKYLLSGEIPYMNGNTCNYIDPADLLIVKEYDWTRTDIPEEAETAIRKSLMKRFCFTLLRFDWRKHSYFKFHKTKAVYEGRVKNKRSLNLVPERPPQLADFKVKDWVRLISDESTENKKVYLLNGEKGQVSQIWWSPLKSKHKGNTDKCWMARVEFKQQKEIHSGNGKYYRPRFHYTVRLDQLEKTEPPTKKEKELSKTYWAVYGREVKQPRRVKRQRAKAKKLLETTV